VNRRNLLILAALFVSIAATLAWACDPPYVWMPAPGDGATVSGITTIEVKVQSETEVQGVDIYLDEALLTTLAAEPYKYEWDTAKVANGTHTLYAKARALERSDGVSATITVTVKNEEAPPPSAE